MSYFLYSHSPDNHTRNVCPGEMRNCRKIQRKEKPPKSRHPEPGRGETAMHLLGPSTHAFTYALVGTILYTRDQVPPASGPALFTQ